MITISGSFTTIGDSVVALVVPAKAVEEPGYIKGMTTGAESGKKHELHALAQMAYYQHQDDELEVTIMQGDCRVEDESGVETLVSGLVIYRSSTGLLHVIAHGDVNCKKLLEAANRYCTRWVRLDI